MSELRDPRQDPAEDNAHWALLRDLLVFQGKLVVDGLRDLVLSPISLGAVLIGILRHRRDPGRYFRRLVRWGARTERWIDLFNSRAGDARDAGLDDLFAQIEQRVVDQYQRGGVTAQAKAMIDRSLSSVQGRVETLMDQREAPAPSADPPSASSASTCDSSSATNRR